MLPKVCALFFLFSLLVNNFVIASFTPEVNLNLTAQQHLKRKKRYIAFPDGSSVAASICLTIGMLGNPNVNYISWAENWGVAYNLPNYMWAKQHAHGFKNNITDAKAVIQRRSRRDLYEKIETIMNNMGFDGHACIERALCESSKYLHQLNKQRGNMMMEIIKTIFSLPLEPVYAHEPSAIHEYDRVFRRARRDLSGDCRAEHSRCKFSLLELAFGKYTLEPSKHGTRAWFGIPGLKFM